MSASACTLLMPGLLTVTVANGPVLCISVHHKWTRRRTENVAMCNRDTTDERRQHTGLQRYPGYATTRLVARRFLTVSRRDGGIERRVGRRRAIDRRGQGYRMCGAI